MNQRILINRVSAVQSKFEELIAGCMDHQYGVSEDFISAGLARELRQNLITLDQDDRMKKAGIGNNLVKDTGQDKRGDRIFWMDNESEDKPERAFLDQIDAFVRYLNETCYVGISDYEFHYALYDTGSSYQRHVDQFQNNNHRKFSLIHYLNNDWTPEHGGELMIYQQNETEKILPNIRKAVFFQSDACEHAVSPATRPRMSISGWLKTS